MGEADRIFFSLREISELLVKKQGVHEGLWGLSIEFGLAAQNIPTSPDGDTIVPAALSLVQRIGIQRFEKPNNMTVDAAEVNPRPKGGKVPAGLGMGKAKRGSKKGR